MSAADRHQPRPEDSGANFDQLLRAGLSNTGTSSGPSQSSWERLRARMDATTPPVTSPPATELAGSDFDSLIRDPLLQAAAQPHRAEAALRAAGWGMLAEELGGTEDALGEQFDELLTSKLLASERGVQTPTTELEQSWSKLDFRLSTAWLWRRGLQRRRVPELVFVAALLLSFVTLLHDSTLPPQGEPFNWVNADQASAGAPDPSLSQEGGTVAAGVFAAPASGFETVTGHAPVKVKNPVGISASLSKDRRFVSGAAERRSVGEAGASLSKLSPVSIVEPFGTNGALARWSAYTVAGSGRSTSLGPLAVGTPAPLRRAPQLSLADLTQPLVGQHKSAPNGGLWSLGVRAQLRSWLSTNEADPRFELAAATRREQTLGLGISLDRQLSKRLFVRSGLELNRFTEDSGLPEVYREAAFVYAPERRDQFNQRERLTETSFTIASNPYLFGVSTGSRDERLCVQAYLGPVLHVVAQRQTDYTLEQGVVLPSATMSAEPGLERTTGDRSVISEVSLAESLPYTSDSQERGSFVSNAFASIRAGFELKVKLSQRASLVAGLSADASLLSPTKGLGPTGQQLAGRQAELGVSFSL